MIRFTIKNLEDKCKNRPQGYKQEILERSKCISDGLYELDDISFAELADKYRTPQLSEQFKNFASALMEIPTNTQIRSREEVMKNLAICKVCPFFIESSARCGSCGCDLMLKTMFKVWKCPKNKWI